MKQIIKTVFILLSLIIPAYSVQAEQSQEDAFLAALLRASEDCEESPDERDDTFQALANMEQTRKETLEQSSLMRRYATAFALKALVLYGNSAHYVKQWINYITSFIYKS